jgi:hypothetical protein
MTYFLTIQEDAVVIRNGDCIIPLSSQEDFAAFLRNEAKTHHIAISDVPIFASSSMDFPEEFTSNPATIALAKALRA